MSNEIVEEIAAAFQADQAEESQGWSVADSARTYRIGGWGAPYFAVNGSGRVEVRPDPQRAQGIDLYELAMELSDRGLELPLLIRFPNILQDRIRLLNEGFARAIREYGYKGVYRGVYPVKVNQQRHLVDDVVEFGRPWRFGLEAGSKSELLIALASMKDDEGFIICNGYKDLAYMEAALLAQCFGHTVVIVLERVEELEFALQAAHKLGVRPVLGVRAKLTTKGAGRWAHSTGERAKFGLTSSEIVDVVERLRGEDMLDCVQLLHFHMGSQVSNILPIKTAMREVSRLYVELRGLGCRMGYLDVGGGLAVDYDGSKADFAASRNYDLQEYCNDVVYSVLEACDEAGVDHPTLVSESGRAIAAHQSVLVFEVLSVDQVRSGEPAPPGPGASPVIAELYDAYKRADSKSVQEVWHDASQAKDEAQSLFRFGYLNLKELAQAESLFWSCCERLVERVREMPVVPEELQGLDHRLAAIYYCNFSIFQSAPDMWAIDQLFPIMPIHRLEEEPSVRATLADLTCDSDGVLDKFIDIEDVKHALELHPTRKGEPYLLGMFINGAYQEILGDLHNLFGDTNAVHVRVEDDGYSVDHVIKGDSVAEVLHYVQYEPEDMVERVRRQGARALQRGRMKPTELRRLMARYEASLRGYTYLERDD